MALGRRWQGCPSRSVAASRRNLLSGAAPSRKPASLLRTAKENSQRKQPSRDVFFFVGGILLPITANLVG
jgi:hypothetical protein